MSPMRERDVRRGGDVHTRRVVLEHDGRGHPDVDEHRGAGETSGEDRGEGGNRGRRPGPDPGQRAGIRQAHGVVEDELQIVPDPPLVVPIEDLIVPGTA